MTIKYKIGDLIEATKSGEVTHIAHQANCFHCMGAGIAPQIKDAFPEAYNADIMQTDRGDMSKMGTFSKSISTSGPTVYNIYGQYGADYKGLTYGTKYWALANGLHLMYEDIMDDMLIAHDVPVRIGFPKLGCGLAGGDWTIVEAIINDTFRDLDVTVYVLDFKELPAHEQWKYRFKDEAINDPDVDIFLKED